MTTKDEALRLALEALTCIDDLKTFAERVAAAAKAEEREACAKAVEAEAHMFETLAAAKSLSAAIRARGEA